MIAKRVPAKMRNLARAIFGELEVFCEPNPNCDLLNSGTVVHLDKKNRILLKAVFLLYMSTGMHAVPA